MRSTLVLFTLVCLALAHTGCAEGMNANGANTAPTSNANASAGGATLAPLPENADARAYYERGMEAYKKNLDTEAVAAFEQAVRLEPDFAASHYRLGLAYAAVGRDEDAEKSFEAAVKWFGEASEQNPDDAESHFHLGLAQGKLGKYREAVKAFKQSVRYSPDDSEKYYELGLAHSKLAEYREAVNALDKALALDPNHHRASEARERARQGLERREDFLKDLAKQKQKRANQNASPSPSPAPGDQQTP